MCSNWFFFLLLLVQFPWKLIPKHDSAHRKILRNKHECQLNFLSFLFVVILFVIIIVVAADAAATCALCLVCILFLSFSRSEIPQFFLFHLET